MCDSFSSILRDEHTPENCHAQTDSTCCGKQGMKFRFRHRVGDGGVNRRLTIDASQEDGKSIECNGKKWRDYLLRFEERLSNRERDEHADQCHAAIINAVSHGADLNAEAGCAA